MRQIRRRADTGDATAAADDEELRPLRMARAAWTHDRWQRGVPYGRAEFEADALGQYERRYGSVPDQPLETWDERFLTTFEIIPRERFEAEWANARRALGATS